MATENQTMREWEIVRFAPKFTSFRFVKQEDFCGVMARTYFVKNCLDLP